MEETKTVSQSQFIEEVMTYIEYTKSNMLIQPDAKPDQRALPKHGGADEFIYSISVREPTDFYLEDLHTDPNIDIPPGVSVGHLIYYEIYSLPEESMRKILDSMSRNAERIEVKIPGRRRRGFVDYQIQKDSATA